MFYDGFYLQRRGYGRGEDRNEDGKHDGLADVLSSRARGECWAGYFTAVHDAAVKRRDDAVPAEGTAP